MKKVFVAILTVALMSSFGFAKPNVVMGGNAKKFLKNRHHLVHKQQGAEATQEASSYVVKVDESSKKTMSDFKDYLKGWYKVGMYKTEKNVAYFKNEGLRVDISDVKTNREKCAQRILNKIVPVKYANQFKLVSIDEEWGFSETESAEVTTYTFNFKRVFNGRVVRNGDNFLSIDISKDGQFKGADVALQDLALTTETVVTDGDAEENEATLDSLVNTESEELDIIIDNGGFKKTKMKSINVGSVAEAYCEVEDGSDKKLFPCLSYATKVSLEDGNAVSRIIDVPHSRGSWRHNRQGKKPLKFHRFNR